MSFRAVLFFALVVVSGCASAPQGIGCDIETSSRRGRGVIVGPKHVLTIWHVVSGYDRCTVDELPARVVTRSLRKTETGEDGIVILELESGEFPRERIATISEKAGPGVVYIPSRGEHPWPWGLEPGDSGSPILDRVGHVTGLVRAVYGRAEPLERASVSGALAPGDS